MKIVIAGSYKETSKMAANDLIETVRSNQHPLICLASGDTPTGMYRELVSRYNQGDLDIQNWNFIALDEWIGMNGEDEGSCRFYLNNTFFKILEVSEDRVCCFNGKAADTNLECSRIERYIEQHNGIDIAIVGLGLNGHVGLNEPGTDPLLHSHISLIDSVTQQAGQKYFTEQKQLTHGITLGLANLMEAKKVILLVSGKQKAAIIKKVLEGDITEQVPASLLRKHPDFIIYLDEKAAELLSGTNYEKSIL